MCVRVHVCLCVCGVCTHACVANSLSPHMVPNILITALNICLVIQPNDRKFLKPEFAIIYVCQIVDNSELFL